MRLPNGFGNVSKLPGARRKPWRARKTVGWDIDQVTKKAKQVYATVGYYATRNEAMQALAAYNRDPYDLDAEKITFAEVYELWAEEKYPDLSASRKSDYANAYKALTMLHKMRMVDVKLLHLQTALDRAHLTPSKQQAAKIVMRQLFDYANAHEIINRSPDLVSRVKVQKIEKSTLHYRFTDEEIETLWENADDEYVMVILMMLYSGVRPGEMLTLQRSCVHLDKDYFDILKGKTVNAARKVPIHKKTRPFFEHWMAKGTPTLLTNEKGKKLNLTYYAERFESVLLRLGILTYINEQGETAEHKPDDTRHTFTSLWMAKGLNEVIRRKIQGHSGKGVGEQVYTHFLVSELCQEINKI